MGCLVHCDPHFLLGFEVDTIPGPAKPGGTEGPGGTSPAMMGGWGKLRGVGHSLYLGCPSGLTLEADFISGKDHHAPWRLSRDHRRLHHYRQGGEGHQAQSNTPEQWDGGGHKTARTPGSLDRTQEQIWRQPQQRQKKDDRSVHTLSRVPSETGRREGGHVGALCEKVGAQI